MSRTCWLVGALLAVFLPFGLLDAVQEKGDGIEQVERGLFRDASGPRWTIEERMRVHKVPGVSVAVVRGKKVAWAKGYGVAEAGGKTPVTIATLFQAASMSKPIAALLALLLADQGRIDIDEDVNKYLRRWKLADNGFTKNKKVTVRGLVSE